MSKPVRLPVPLPTLADVQADLSAFDSLPRQMQDALFEQAAVLEARLRAKVIARKPKMDERAAAEPDRAIRVEEAVSLLAVTEDYLYRNWPKLGGYKDTDGHVKFPMSVIQRHIRKGNRSGPT